MSSCFDFVELRLDENLFSARMPFVGMLKALSSRFSAGFGGWGVDDLLLLLRCFCSLDLVRCLLMRRRRRHARSMEEVLFSKAGG